MRLFARPAPERPRLDPDFWQRDLRCGRYATVLRALRNPAELGAEVARALPLRRHAVYVADRLEAQVAGRVDDLHRAICANGEGAFPYLLAASFAANKPARVLHDAVSTTLGAPYAARCHDGKGRPDRLLLAFTLLDERPSALPLVRALAHWHRLGTEALVLAEPVAPPRRPMAEFLTEEAVNEAVRDVKLPRNVPPIRFDLHASPPGGGDVVVLRRNRRRAAIWDDPGDNIQHGHDEEAIVLHFTDQGRRVRASAPRSAVVISVAEAIVSAWYGPVDDRAARLLVQAIAARHVPDVRIVEVCVSESPVDGAPWIALGARGRPDLSDSLRHFEATIGPLLERLDVIDYLVLDWRGQRVRLNFHACPGGVRLEVAAPGLDPAGLASFYGAVGAKFGIDLAPSL